MKRAHFLVVPAILIFTPPVNAQTATYDSLYHTLGVSTVRTIIIENGDTTLNELERYNRNGYKTAFRYSTTQRKRNVDIRDTFIVRSADMYTWICGGDRRIYDSTNTITRHGSYDTITTSYFKKGKVVIQKVHTRTRQSEVLHHRYFEKPKSEFIQTTTLRFDDQGRLTEKVTCDSLFSNNRREQKSKYFYYYQYTAGFEIMKVYKVSGDTTCSSFSVFTSTDGSYDSTIMYAEQEKVDYYFVRYSNKNGRDTLSTTRNGTGALTNRNKTVYSPGYTKTEHADGTGFVFKTHEWFLNEKGLVAKETETDHRSGDVRTVNYEYTFY